MRSYHLTQKEPVEFVIYEDGRIRLQCIRLHVGCNVSRQETWPLDEFIAFAIHLHFKKPISPY